ncbi:hypothetical protein DL98DRAFT_567782 [Cadophora sp. DSE1049]|nr:hypothetical protein DL98DRAFT_567782 [Cadophora sp. DSE1049]
MSTSRPSHQPGSENEKVRCDHGSGDCPILFRRSEDMLRHKAEVHGDAKKCPWCDYSARRDYRLWNHLHGKHEARKYTPRKSHPGKNSKSPSTQQPLPRDDQSRGTTKDNKQTAGDDPQSMAPQSMAHVGEQYNHSQQANQMVPSFNQPFAQPVYMVERLQQAQTSASLAKTPHGSFESQNTFGYIPTGHVSHGMGVNNYPQRPPSVSDQLPIRQVDFPLVSDHPSESFPAPLRSQQQHFEQSAWNGSVYPQTEYPQYEMGYQTLVDTPLAFNQLPPVTPTNLQSTLPRTMPGAVDGAADAWGTHTSSSPMIDRFANSTTDYFSGNSENDQDPTYCNEVEDWDIDHE